MNIIAIDSCSLESSDTRPIGKLSSVCSTAPPTLTCTEKRLGENSRAALQCGMPFTTHNLERIWLFFWRLHHRTIFRVHGKKSESTVLCGGDGLWTVGGRFGGDETFFAWISSAHAIEGFLSSSHKSCIIFHIKHTTRREQYSVWFDLWADLKFWKG